MRRAHAHLVEEELLGGGGGGMPSSATAVRLWPARCLSGLLAASQFFFFF
jgi:hypothetical protein